MELNKILTNVLQNVYKSKDVSNIINKFQIKYFYNTISITNSLQNFIEYYFSHIGLIKTCKIYKDITINYFLNGIKTKNYTAEKNETYYYIAI
jgi:hypothetical protein